MSRKRAASDEERALFEAVIKNPDALSKKPTAKPQKPKPEIVKQPARKSLPKPAGLDGRTQERLRRGQIEPEASLDLHGMTETTAHRALLTFLRGASARGLRLVIVVTGKGLEPPAPDEPFEMERERRGVLKTMTPRWLAEPELARFVAEVRSAHRKHGGTGALYIYLRKAVK